MIKKGNLYFPTEEFKKKAWVNDKSVYNRATDQLAFWEEKAKALDWIKKWDKVFDFQPEFFLV